MKDESGYDLVMLILARIESVSNSITSLSGLLAMEYMKHESWARLGLARVELVANTCRIGGITRLLATKCGEKKRRFLRVF